MLADEVESIDELHRAGRERIESIHGIGPSTANTIETPRPMSYTYFLIDVPFPGGPSLIAQGNDAHLLDHAEDTLAETVAETTAGWFEPTA